MSDEALTVGQAQQIAEAAIERVAEATAAAAREQAKFERRKRMDWDVRGILAIMALFGSFALAGAQLAQGRTAEIPAWAAAVVAGVTGFYFGSRGGGGEGGR